MKAVFETNYAKNVTPRHAKNGYSRFFLELVASE